MALKIKYKSRFGLAVESAYMRVDGISGGKSEMSASFGLYADAESAAEGADAFDVYEHKFTPSLDGENFIHQAYNSVKAVEGFDNAIDC
jgi:hypothetical protein